MNGASQSRRGPVAYIKPLSVRGRVQRAHPKGLPLINLGYNELPYGPSPRVAEAIFEGAAHVNSYGAPGCDDVRSALGKLHRLDPETLICGNGSEELLDVIGRSFARPGDEVLISAYGYIQFQLVAHRVGATVIKAPECALTTDVDALLGAVTPRTRLVFLANPNNPTGTFLPLVELRRLLDALPEEVVIVLDLAYGEFAGQSYCASVHTLASGRDNVIVTRTFSKAYGLAGLRVGWAQAPKRMLPGFYATRGMGSVNNMAQRAACAALADFETVQRRVAETVAERERVARALTALDVMPAPSRTNFLMVALRGAGPDVTEALVEYLFDEGGFIVNRTREAGLERYLRFSMGLPAQNDALINCVAAFQRDRL